MGNNRRPWDTQLKLKNGFYIEVCNKGTKKGMKIRSENKKLMEDAIIMYSTYKDIIILGEYRDGVPLSEGSAT